MKIRRLASTIVIACLLSTVPTRGDFTNVINAPPDVIAPGATFGSDTQINLYPGTASNFGDVLHLGGFNVPVENAQLNILGGSAWNVEAWTGSQFNVIAGSVGGANLLGGSGTMSGGVVSYWTLFARSSLQMSGGFAAHIYTAGATDGPSPKNSSFVLTGGEVGVLDATGNVTIQGGTVDQLFFRGGGSLEVSGGSIGDDLEAGSVVIGSLPDDPTREMSSSPGESHPQALTEPDVNLSTHPALIVQSRGEFRFAIARTSSVLGGQRCPANEPLVDDGKQIV